MMRSKPFPPRWRRVIALVTAVVMVTATIVVVHALQSGTPAGVTPAIHPVAVRPVVQRRARKVHLTRSWHHPRPVWPAAGTGVAVISPASNPGQPQVPTDAKVSQTTVPQTTVPQTTVPQTTVPQSMPAGPTAGSGRAGTTVVWVGPAATHGALAPTRSKMHLNSARYPDYRLRGKPASRPHGAPATGLPDSSWTDGTRAGAPGPRPSAPASRRAGSREAGMALGDPASPASSAPVRSARVRVLSHQATRALGITGTVFTVARADRETVAGRVHVSLDYTGFRYAYGGDYAARLHLVELPGCAVTTPQVAACRRQTPLVTGNDARTARAGADVLLPGASAGAIVLAATTSAQGSAGDYAAEPVSEMTQWLSGASSGAYEYNYPITVPPVPGGLQPTAALRYDSQLADGVSAAANPEASETGDGWQSAVPGYIEINYQTCAANWSEPDILDLCDQVESQTITLNGATDPVALSSSGMYKQENDDGSNVQQLSDGGWEITETDGTKYYFGLDKLPGWTSGDPLTNSIWTVPLWSGNSEETADGAWRYMLDYVVNPEGDAIAYFYNTQNNYYATDGGSTANGEYTSGGVLTKVEYGLVNSSNVFTQTPSAQLNYSYSTTRQDAPTDLACTSGAACSVNAPTFWTTDALTGITTESLVGSSLQPVDSYQLTDSFPATGDPTSSPNLWLASIQQTGEDGSPPITLPPTDFTPSPMANLDQTATDKSANYSLITRDRLTMITNDTGGETTIAYTAVQSACSSGNFPTLWTNSDRCYPDYWYTDPLADTYRLDWYNLYAASSVTQTDTTAGGEPDVTSYSYGPPGWHYDNDAGSVSAYPTWDEWRGFQTVTTETGTAPDPVTETVDTYYQGLSDDQGAYSVDNGGLEGTATVTITTSRNLTVTDSDQYAGMLLEHRVFDGATGSEISDTEYSVPWSTQTAAQTYDSSLYEYVDADLDDSTSTVQFTDLAGGGSDETTITYSLNSSDDVLSEDVKPWGAAETCTTTSYVTNTASDLAEPYVVKVNAGSCSSPGALVSETEYAYDGGSFGATPTEGLVTSIKKTITSSGTTALTTMTYDQYGRVTSVTDPDQRTTTTAYTPATGAEPTQITVTDPMGLATVTTYDPARELPLTATTPAGDTTTVTYDALGRSAAKWTPGNPTSGNPQARYSYTVSQTAPTTDTTQTQEPGGSYLTSETLYDSLDREIEVQAETASGGSDITQYSYNSDGLKSFAEGPYYTSSAPSGTLVTAAESAVTDETGYTYDGAGRLTAQTSYDDGAATWSTTVSYGGNYFTQVPPTGGTSQTVFQNALQQVTALYQYHAGVTASPSDPSSDYDETSYAYTPGGKIASVTDAAGNHWSFSYDLLGDQLTQTYPDSGTATASYDAASQLLSETDARGKTTSFTYDKDGRETGEYDTTGGAGESPATEIASWTWDTLAKGLLTSSTSYSGGAAYTEQYTGYNDQGLPQGQQTIIPSAQGALAGTYTTSYTYAPDGRQTSYTDSAAGGLPAETVTTGYNTAGEPDSLTGASTYVASLSYTGLDQPQEYTLGTSAAPVSITDSYNPQTADLAEQQVQTGTTPTTVDDLHYSYDADGLITAEADTPSGATADTDVQCFSYDYLGRLSEAWAQGSTNCVSNPTAASEGGPAPYLEQYTYNTENDLTDMTSTATTGTATTTTFGYPAAGSAGPHEVTSSSTIIGSGSPSTASYGYDADGDLTGVTNSAGKQALTWSDAGELTQIAVTLSGGGAQDTNFVYDASGNELIRTDPGTATLYLSDEELVLNTSTGAVTGTRFYSIGGQPVAASASSGGSTVLVWLAGDSQDTETIAIDASTLAVTRRWYDPFGNAVGTPPAAFPDGEKGFVGGTADPATGLVNLGAREYQSATGSFISPDPILKPFDPPDLNPYAYCENDPASYSDPSGTASDGGPTRLPGGSESAGKLSADMSWNTPIGELTITVKASLKTGGSIAWIYIGDTSATIQVQTPAKTFVNFNIDYAGAEADAASVARPLPEEAAYDEVNRTPDCDYCETGVDLGTYKGQDVQLSVGPASVTVSIEGDLSAGSGKSKTVIAYEVDIEFRPMQPPNAFIPTLPPLVAKEIGAAVSPPSSDPIGFVFGIVAGIIGSFERSAEQTWDDLVKITADCEADPEYCTVVLGDGG